MFESSFPVDKGMCGYGVLWDDFNRLATGAGQDKRAALSAGTATHIYRLNEAPGCEALRAQVAASKP
jgi:hypothetical protein